MNQRYRATHQLGDLGIRTEIILLCSTNYREIFVVGRSSTVLHLVLSFDQW